MKKFPLFFLGMLVCAGAFAQKKTIVTGKVTSKNPVEKVYLRYASEGEYVIDSSSVEKGVFSFTPSISEPEIAMIRIKHPAKDSASKPGYEMRSLFLEPGNSSILITDSLKDAVIKGGRAQKDFETLTVLEKPFNEKSKALSSQYMQYRKDNDQEGMDRLENEFDALDSIMKQEVYLKFLKANLKSPVALYGLESYAGYDLDPAAISPLYDQLSEATRNSKSGKAFHDRLELAKKTAVGAMAMDFTQNDTLDKPVSLSDFKGKYVLVDFWASWCGPCRAENPNVVKAFNEYKDKNFTVLGISLDREGQKEAWLGAIHKDDLTWTQVSDLKFWDNAVAKQYGIRAIPQNLLINPDGKIIAKNIRGEELTKKLDEVLK